MKSINPANEQLVKEYPAEDMPSIQSKLTELQITFYKWREVTIERRIEVINNLANILETNKAEYAFIMTTEMGKLKSQAIKEVEKCATLCKYYADNAKEFLAPKNIPTSAKNSYVTFSPLGIVLGVMPWNYPFWQAFRFAVPTILAGNVVMLKHASNVSGCSLAIEAIFNEAAEDLNLPILKSVLIEGTKVADIIANPLIQAVSLTGSVDAGKSVASTAGKYIKKTVLELGGSDPCIILADADLVKTVTTCAEGRLSNAGQSCVSPKRFIVHQDVYNEFLKLLTEKFTQIKIGDPSQEDTNLGPLANKQIFDTVTEQIAQTIAAGATCHFGGKKVNNLGYFLQPTIITNIPQSSPAYKDEIFGPVASVFKVANEQEAIALANDTSFGLGASIFTQNLDRAAEIAEKHLNSGMVFINSNVFSDPRLPFGGIKQSGYGRELSEFGIHEFVNIKTISIN